MEIIREKRTRENCDHVIWETSARRAGKYDS